MHHAAQHTAASDSQDLSADVIEGARALLESVGNDDYTAGEIDDVASSTSSDPGSVTLCRGPGSTIPHPSEVVGPPYPMRKGPNPPPGRWPACLGVLTHNVHGMQADSQAKQAKVHALMHLWVELRVGIICVQETWLGPEHIAETEAHLRAAAIHLHVAPFQAFWACNQAGKGGVGILIRSDLIAQAHIQLPSDHSHIRAAPDGRMLSIRLRWGHHAFTLANVYLPSGNSPAQQEFIATCIGPLYDSTKGHLVVVGDFKYTENFAIDDCTWQATMLMPKLHVACMHVAHP